MLLNFKKIKQIFQKHYVPYIVMEWTWVKINMNGLCPFPQQLIEVFNFFNLNSVGL